MGGSPRSGVLRGVALLAVFAIPAARADLPDDAFRETGERTLTPILADELTVLRDPATGRKSFRRGDGRRFDSLEQASLAEEETLPPLQRLVDRELWPHLDAAPGDSTPVEVVLVLRLQPVHEEAVPARARLEERIRPRLATLRAALSALAPARAEDPARVLPLGARQEEEARLLGPERREELRALRREILDLVQAMRREVMDTARPRAAADQAPLAARVAAVPGARVLGRSVVLSAVSAALPAGALRPLLEASPEVARVLPHRTCLPALETSVATLGASTWTGAGYDGSSSTRVAVLDTGVDSSHPALASVVAAEAVYLGSLPPAITDAPSFADDVTSTDDFHGHGTHVAGISGSADATVRGVAPGAALLNGKCGFAYINQGVTYAVLFESDIRSAGDWAASKGADVVNASFGGAASANGNSSLTRTFEALAHDLGVSVAAGAGNSGPGSGTVGSPADAYNAIAVGALDDAATAAHSDNVIASFSSRGPMADGRRKPDLCAPGVAISSCSAAWEGEGSDFVDNSGTSMATPHVAGAVALLADYAASWRPEGIKALLLGTTRNSAPYPTAPDMTWGWGAADLSAAFTCRASVLEGSLPSSGPAFTFVRTGSLAAGGRATLAWSREPYRAVADLDLFVYEDSDGTARGSSTSALDSVEQVALSAASTSPVLKIRRVGAYPSGQTTASWAIAAESSAASAEVLPPDLSCAFVGLPAAVGGDAVFDVTVAVANSGGLSVPATSVNLALPDGYTLLSGSNPRTLGTLAASGGSATASWQVRAPSAGGGAQSLTAVAIATAFGETFESPVAEGDQVLDPDAPTGSVAIESDAAAVADGEVALLLDGGDVGTGIVEMRLRNEGEAWGPWEPWATAVDWSLAAGEGIRTVEAQVRDGVGNISAQFSDSILVDATPPTGSFVLAGGAEYVMPWEAIKAETSFNDGAGSGVAAFRYRWSAEEEWSAWVAPPGPLVPLERPAAHGSATAEGEFRDGAGNVASAGGDGLHLVEPDPPSLTWVRQWRGSLAAGGGVRAFRIGCLPGDLVTVRLKGAPFQRGDDFTPRSDLFDPSKARVVLGGYPADAKRDGIAAFPVSLAGDHWLVLRAEGADAAAGGGCRLAVKVRRARENLRGHEIIEPIEGVAEFEFLGIEGATLGATLRGPVSGGIELLAPGGAWTPVPASLLRGGVGSGVRVSDVALSATGLFRLRAAASGVVEVRYRVRR